MNTPSTTKRDEAVVRFYAIDMVAPFRMPRHVHNWDRLIYASRGVLSVHSDFGTLVVPPQRAVWVPASLPHAVELHGGVSMRTLHLHPSLEISLSQTCKVLNVTPFLRELILRIVVKCPLMPDDPIHRNLLGVLVDELEVVEAAPLDLPTPRDPRARAVAEVLAARPGDPRSLVELARDAGASARTIERLFLRETGLGFGHWRRQRRLLTALRLLAAGEPVSDVAMRVGYQTPGAFIAVFKAALGTTPGTYFNSAKESQLQTES